MSITDFNLTTEKKEEYILPLSRQVSFKTSDLSFRKPFQIVVPTCLREAIVLLKLLLLILEFTGLLW